MSRGRKNIITRKDVEALHPGDALHVGPDTILTPFAREQALRRGVRIVESSRAGPSVSGASGAAPKDVASFASGVSGAARSGGSSSTAGFRTGQQASSPPGTRELARSEPPAAGPLPVPSLPPEVRSWLDAGGRAAIAPPVPPRGYEAIQLRRPLPPAPRASAGLAPAAAEKAVAKASSARADVTPAPEQAAPGPAHGTLAPPREVSRPVQISPPPAARFPQGASEPRGTPAAHPAIAGARLLRENDGHLPGACTGGFPYTGREHLVVPIRVVGRCGQGVLPRLFQTLEGYGCHILQAEHRAVQDFYEATVLVDLQDATLDLASLHRKVQELQRPGECHVSVHAMAARSNPAPQAYPGT